MDLGSVFGRLGFEYDDRDLRKAERDLVEYADTNKKAGRAMRDMADDSKAADKGLSGIRGAAKDAEKGLRDSADAGRDAGSAFDETAGKTGGLAGALAGLAGEGEGALGSFLGKVGDLDIFGKGLGDIAGKATDLLPKLAGGGGLSGGMATLAASINPVTIAAAAAGVALVKMAQVGVKAAMDMNAGQRAAQAQFGLTAAEAEKLGSIGEEVFANNWAPSIEEATIAAGKLRVAVGDISDEDLVALAQGAAALEAAFQIPQEETAKMLQGMKQFGLEGTEALDLVTVAIQKSAEPADEAIATFHEYGTNFKNLGFSAEEMTAILVSGSEAGAFSMDKVGDAVKEMGVLLSAGSEGTREQLDKLSPGLSDLVDQFKAGEISGKEAFEAIQLAMANYQGNVDPDMLANIFGSPGEDLSKEIVMSLSTSTAALGDWNDAAMNAGSATLTIGDSLQSIKNTAGVVLGNLFEPMIDMLEAKVKPALDNIQANFLAFKDTATFDVLVVGARAFAKVLELSFIPLEMLIEGVSMLAGPVAGWVDEASEGFMKAARFVGLAGDEAEEAGEQMQGAGVKTDESAQALIDASAAAAQAAESEKELAKAAEERADAMEKAQQSLNDNVMGALTDLRSAQLNYARDIQDARAKDAADSAAMRQKVAEGEAEHVEKMNALNEKLHNSEGKAQAKAAEQIAAEQERWAGIVGEAEAGTQAAAAAVEQRYDQERQAIRESLAQTVVDHTNAMVLMGEVSEETAKSVFQALSQAYPDVEVINPATEATLAFNATLNDVLSGDRDASAIVEAIDGVESAMMDSEALNAEEWGIENAFDRAGTSSEEMYARIGASADGVGSDTEAMNERVSAAHGELAGTLDESGARAAAFADGVGQQGKRVVDQQAGMADGVRAAQENVRNEFAGTEAKAGSLASGITFSMQSITDELSFDNMAGLTSLENNLQTAEQQAGTTARSLGQLNAAAAELEKPAQEGGSAFDRAARDIEDGAGRGQRSIESTKSATEDLNKAIEDLPDEIEVDLAQLLKQLDSAHVGLRRMITDIDAARAAGIEGVPIRAWIQAESPGAADGGSIWYEHYIEDARAEGEKGIGIRTWMDGSDALDEALALLDYANQLSALIDEQEVGINRANELLAEATRRAQEYAAEFTATITEVLSSGKLREALGGASGALGEAINMFQIDPKFPEVLKRIPEAADFLNGLRDTFSMDNVFGNIQILDPDTLLPFESLEAFQAKMRELQAEPEKQRELWDQFKDAAGSAFEIAGAKAIESIEAFKDRIGPDGVDQLREGIEGLSNAVASEVNRWAEELTEQMGEQLDLVDAQAEIYDRLLELEEERAKALEEAKKALADAIKTQEREQLDAEKRVHDATMALLEEEEERMERQHDRRMDLLDERLDAEKAAMDEAEAEHERRMERLDEETERLQERYDTEARSLSDLKAAMGALDDGFELTDYERSALEAMGFDPDELAAAVAESKKLKEEAKGLVDLLSGLGEDRERVTKDDLSQGQRDALQKALDEGAISDPDERRRIEILLNSKGGIASGQVRGIIERLAKGEEGAGGAEETDPLQAVKDRIAEREREQEILKHSIDEEKRAAQELKDAEAERWAAEKQGYEDRIGAIEAEQDAEKERYDAAREALREQMDLQKEAHDERMRQIQEQYALELLRLGEGEEAVQAYLDRQRQLAAQIADEAARRAAEAVREASAGLPAENVSLPGQPGVGLPVPPPGTGPVLPPPGGSTTDSAGGGYATDYPGSMTQTNAELKQMIDLAAQAQSGMDDLRRKIDETVGQSGGGGTGAPGKVNSDNSVTLYGNIIAGSPDGDLWIERLLEALGS